MYSLKTPLLTAILSAGLIAGTAAQAEEQLLIGSTSTSSSQYGYFVAVGQIINQHVDGVRTSVVETGATVDNLRRILRNQVDMGPSPRTWAITPMRVKESLKAAPSITACFGSILPKHHKMS